MTTWESIHYEADRSDREGESARDRRAVQHLRELEVSRERPRREERGSYARPLMWLVRAAQTAASWLA